MLVHQHDACLVRLKCVLTEEQVIYLFGSPYVEPELVLDLASKRA